MPSSSSLVQLKASAPKANLALTTRGIYVNQHWLMPSLLPLHSCLGALASVLSGFLGMKISTYANARTTLEARKGVGKAFNTTFRSGALRGFLLAANGLLVLWVFNSLFKLYYGDDWEGLFESITGAVGILQFITCCA